ncbi:cytochrome c biogenesis CcdA family protein [Alteribacillus iranensis]|uniref:Cytochrome c-type biogenesis protein n=1 Tax=Alteribacillus iranensis TaxID=930128 RepID=A0A1I2E388_9BACI|nr:cytochrome c biogenesis protein CcdA [Alteribacillus iranensis]SFE87103.1 cytochrome c-type biogenesis protein [Alteribacillus iranensis]
MGAADVTIWLALWAGFISFISPCTLPLFPAYLSYITGVGVKDLQGNQTKEVRMKVLTHSLFFLAGVSTVFIGLGLGASYAGQFVNSFLRGDSGLLLQRISGVFVIIMGLYIAGWLNIKLLAKDKRLRFTKKPAGYAGTTLVGIGFAAGWTPCIGPIFASILMLAASQPSSGLWYTSFYVVGFSVPFLALGFFAGSTKWIIKYSNIIMKIGGVLLIIIGVLLYTGELTRLSIYLLRLVEGTWFANLG